MGKTQESLALLIGGGLLLVVLGGALAITMWPATEPGLLGGELETGNAGAAGFGAVAALVGFVMLLVGAVGCGSRLGREK